MGSLGINSIDGDMNPYLSLTVGVQGWGKGPWMFIFPKKRARDWVSEWGSDGETVHSYWRCCTLKCWAKLWSSCHITLISPISPFLCSEELLCCGKLPKAEWKGPFIMRKWHNTQSPHSWVWHGSFKALMNRQIKHKKRKKNCTLCQFFLLSA